MPLSFQSLSHGEVAFGFFNIETDLLLMENVFFFASDFCRLIARMASFPPDEKERPWEVFRVTYEQMGNLHGAIQGYDLRGFLGAIYQRFPFPRATKDFRQNPEGYRTQKWVQGLIRHYGRTMSIAIYFEADSRNIRFGEFHYSLENWAELIHYVWMGGYPRWRDGIRPEYVQAMKESIEKSRHPLFEGITFPIENFAFSHSQSII